MYLDEYKRWLAADLEDSDLHPELAGIEGNDDEIKDRFAVALKFGTAGLRGVLGAGTNRMNIYVVRQATQGLANWVKTQGGNSRMWPATHSMTVAYTALKTAKKNQLSLLRSRRAKLMRWAPMPYKMHSGPLRTPRS